MSNTVQEKELNDQECLEKEIEKKITKLHTFWRKWRTLLRQETTTSYAWGLIGNKSYYGDKDGT